MRQCTAGNIVYAGVEDRGDIFFCHISGALGFCSAVDDGYRLFHLRRSHIVEHDNVGTCICCFADHINIFALDFNLAHKRSIIACHLDRFCDTACSSNMVVL